MCKVEISVFRIKKKGNKEWGGGKNENTNSSSAHSHFSSIKLSKLQANKADILSAKGEVTVQKL